MRVFNKFLTIDNIPFSVIFVYNSIKNSVRYKYRATVEDCEQALYFLSSGPPDGITFATSNADRPACVYLCEL